MIAVDTNILLRYLLEDNREQSGKAAKLFAGRRKILVTDVVLAETIWTLKGKKYQLKKPDLITVIHSLFQEPNLRFEDGQVVWTALNDYRKSKPIKGKDADFSDALIINKAKAVIEKQHDSFGGAYTFDVAAQSLPGMKKL